jgi:hypothetical protein
MAIEIKHPFVSAKSDGPDSTLIQPSNWNAGHTLTMGTSFLIGRTTAGAGTAEEISVGAGLVLSSGSLTVDAELAALAGLTSAADRLPYFTGSGTASLATFTSFMRTLLDDADQATARSTLGAAAISDIIGQQTISVPAGAMYARTTNGAAVGSAESTTHKVMRKSWDFDATTQEFVQFAVWMPKGWDEGTLICQFMWSHPSTTTNFGVVWAIEAVAFANDDPLDSAFGTAVQVADTGGTTDDRYMTAETAALTVAGSPGAEEWVVFQVKRVPSDGSDNMAVDARLEGVKIHYTTNAATDN